MPARPPPASAAMHRNLRGLQPFQFVPASLRQNCVCVIPNLFAVRWQSLVVAYDVRSTRQCFGLHCDRVSAVFRTNSAFASTGGARLGKMVDSLSACVRMAVSIDGLHSGVYAVNVLGSRLSKIVCNDSGGFARKPNTSGALRFGTMARSDTAWTRHFLGGLLEDDDGGEINAESSSVVHPGRQRL